MAFVRPYIRFTFGGTTAGANEIWSCGLALGHGAEGTDPLTWFANVTAKLPDLGLAVKHFMENTDSRIPANVTLVSVKIALIGTDGKYMTEAVEYPISSTGQINAAYSPQDAMVIGLVSDKFKDPGKNNRFYIPTVGPAGTNEWKLSTIEQSNLAESAADFISEIASVGLVGTSDEQFGVHVVSDAGTGHENVAYTVRVGAIVDTQRRRRNKLQENYVSKFVTPS